MKGFYQHSAAPPGSLLPIVTVMLPALPRQLVQSHLLAPRSSPTNDDGERGTQGLCAVSSICQGCSPLETAATTMVCSFLSAPQAYMARATKVRLEPFSSVQP